MPGAANAPGKPPRAHTNTPVPEDGRLHHVNESVELLRIAGLLSLPPPVAILVVVLLRRCLWKRSRNRSDPRPATHHTRPPCSPILPGRITSSSSSSSSSSSTSPQGFSSSVAVISTSKPSPGICRPMVLQAHQCTSKGRQPDRYLHTYSCVSGVLTSRRRRWRPHGGRSAQAVAPLRSGGTADRQTFSLKC
jgi:hypothetical protein